MTKRERRIREYPQRIALKRLKRRRKLGQAKASKRNDLRHFRSILQEYRASHPASQPIRAGEKLPFYKRITNIFRKPSV